MLESFSNFSEGLILESVINESSIIYSKNLKTILNDLRYYSKDNLISHIAYRLGAVEGTVIKDDITMIDLEQNSDGSLVTFTTSKNVKKEYPEVWSSFFQNDDSPESKTDKEVSRKRTFSSEIDQNIFTKQNRNSIKFGKFIRKVLPDISDSDLEKFLNEFKSKTSGQELVFEILQGKDIIKGYSSEYCENEGTLSKSCMKDKTSLNSNIFKIYTENPESVKLLTLKSSDKIVARALIWQCESFDTDWEKHSGIKPETKFTLMDRVYYSKDFYENKMFSYADKQGWYKRLDSIECRDSSNKVRFFKGKVKIRKLNYPSAPFLDTFSMYYYKESFLTNCKLTNDEGEKREDFALLGSTSGEIYYTKGGLEKFKGQALNFIRRFGEF